METSAVLCAMTVKAIETEILRIYKINLPRNLGNKRHML